jgi:hypothetical protein
MSEDSERWRIIRHNLACRSGHRCELCGIRLGAGEEGTAHHRRPRGAGGSRAADTDDLSNLLLLCGGALGGIQGCHGHIESNRQWAMENGLLVPQGHDPATCIVVLHGGRRVMLDPHNPFYLAPYDGVPYAV